MNITNDGGVSPLIQLMEEIDQLCEDYGHEEDDDVRRDMRKKYKQMVCEYEKISGLKNRVWKKSL